MIHDEVEVEEGKSKCQAIVSGFGSSDLESEDELVRVFLTPVDRIFSSSFRELSRTYEIDTSNIRIRAEHWAVSFTPSAIRRDSAKTISIFGQ
jgi:hypothetical protein